VKIKGIHILFKKKQQREGEAIPASN